MDVRRRRGAREQGLVSRGLRETCTQLAHVWGHDAPEASRRGFGERDRLSVPREEPQARSADDRGRDARPGVEELSTSRPDRACFDSSATASLQPHVPVLNDYLGENLPARAHGQGLPDVGRDADCRRRARAPWAGRLRSARSERSPGDEECRDAAREHRGRPPERSVSSPAVVDTISPAERSPTSAGGRLAPKRLTHDVRAALVELLSTPVRSS